MRKSLGFEVDTFNINSLEMERSTNANFFATKPVVNKPNNQRKFVFQVKSTQYRKKMRSSPNFDEKEMALPHSKHIEEVDSQQEDENEPSNLSPQ